MQSDTSIKPRTTAQLAASFMLHAVQEWGYPVEKRIQSVQDLLDRVGFKATATCWPAFGGIWPTPCEGEDAEAATAWLKELTGSMERGKMEREIAHVQSFIDAKSPS